MKAPGATATLVAAGVVLSVAVSYWVRQGDATGRIAPHLAVYGAAFAAYLIALVVAPRLPPRTLSVALLLALGWRVALVFVPPLLSDDVFRYVWEGRIQHLGGNPYLWADRPEAARWVAARDAVWEGVNHKGYSTLYPPFWELVARGVVSVHDSVRAMKMFVVGVEILAMLVLLHVLDRRGLPRGRILVLAWSPLALVEIAGGGHNDALGLLLVALAVWAIDRGDTRGSAIALALGFATKLLPGLLGLAWFRRYRARDGAIAALVLALVTAPYLSAGGQLLLGLRQYGAHWRFNESLFAAVVPVFSDQTQSLRVCGLVLMALGLVLGVRRMDVVPAGLAMTVAALALSANILPWYALWLLPFLVLRDSPPALLYTGTVALAYLVYPTWQSGERWQVGWDVRALEYGPCVLVALLWWARSRSRDVLLVFVKTPRPGEVKTRLAERMGAALAADLYRALVERVRARTAPQNAEYRRVIVYTPPDDRAAIETWLPGETCVAQQGADLGERMKTAFDRAFARGACRVVLVGSDVPDLSREHVRGAMSALETADVVLGPAQDGGYYLIGLRRPCPALFEGMAWSTPTVAHETLARAQAEGLVVTSLPPLDDLDTADDVRRAWPRLREWLPRDLLARLTAADGDRILEL